MNFIGTDHISTIELEQHETCSAGIQCDLLAVALLQKLPKRSAKATIEYEIGDEEVVDLNTGDADVEDDHNTLILIHLNSYHKKTPQQSTYVQAFNLPNLFSLINPLRPKLIKSNCSIK